MPLLPVIYQLVKGEMTVLLAMPIRTPGGGEGAASSYALRQPAAPPAVRSSTSALNPSASGSSRILWQPRGSQAAPPLVFSTSTPLSPVHLTPGAYTFYTFAPFPSLELFFGSIGLENAKDPAELPGQPVDAFPAGMQVIHCCFNTHSTLMPFSTCGFFYRSLYFALHLSLLWYQRKAFISLFYQ